MLQSFRVQFILLLLVLNEVQVLIRQLELLHVLCDCALDIQWIEVLLVH